MPYPRLNLTEEARPTPELSPEREAEIARLVDVFYERIREEPLLGPVFAEHVADWDAHRVTLTDFWVSAVYQAGRYRGRPLEVHRRLGGLTPEHFARWLGLWQQTVREHVASDAGPVLIAMSRRMAAAMSARLGLDPPELPEGEAPRAQAER